MPITTIPEIRVSGFKYPVYNISYQNNGDRGPGEFTVQFIDEDGIYTPPILSVNKSNVISITGFNNFVVYPISWEIEESSSGKIMTVKFQDGSILLDKLNVGLYKRHGLKSGRFLIIVGKEVDPCEGIDDSTLDACTPCKDENGTREQRKMECRKQNEGKIREVNYTFSELLSKMPVSRRNTPRTNDFYKGTYTGTLREVLQQWCADYGYTFFWDNGIVFVDLSRGITIKDYGIPVNSIISKTYGETLEGTASQSVIASFQLDGESKEYECNNISRGKRMLVFPLKLDDIIPRRGLIMDHYENFNRLQAMCVMSMYSADLRDNYVWFLKENITTPAQAETKKEPIRLMGNLEIKKVFHKNSSEEVNKQAYWFLLAQLGSEEEQKKFIEDKGYFFVGKRNNDLMTKYIDMEYSLATNFIGQYWVRKFGGSVAPENMVFNAPDNDNISYYPRYASIGQFPFVNDLPESVSQADTLFNDLVDVESGESADNFILVRRNPIFVPAIRGSEELTKVSEDMSRYVVKEMGRTNLQDLVKEGESIFIAYEKPKNFSVSSFGEDRHPIEQKYTNISIQIYGFITSYGLRNASSEVFTIQTPNSGGKIKFYLPPQAGINQTNTNGGGGGYTIIVKQNKTFNPDHVVKIPKVELFDGELYSGNTLRNTVTYKDATQQINTLLRSNQPGNCFFSEPLIRSMMRGFINGFQSGNNKPNEFIKYSICGLPTKPYSIKDGLEEFSIQVGDNGIYTSLGFGNRQKTAISPDLSNQRYEQLVNFVFRYLRGPHNRLSLFDETPPKQMPFL